VKDSVLPAGLRRVTLEAGVTAPWAQVAGADGVCLGINRFGASAPASELAQVFGLTGQQVAQAILEQM
jgi:transketolase